MTEEHAAAVPEGASPPPAAVEALTTDIGGVLESMEEVSDYLERVVHAVRRHVTGCDEVGVTVFSGGRPHTAAYTTVQTLEIDAVQYVLDDGPCLDAARRRRENRVDDLADDRHRLGQGRAAPRWRGPEDHLGEGVLRGSDGLLRPRREPRRRRAAPRR